MDAQVSQTVRLANYFRVSDVNKRMLQILGCRVHMSQVFSIVLQFCFDNNQMVNLQQLSRFIYQRLPQWFTQINIKPPVRFSEMVLIKEDHHELMFFPNKDVIESGRLLYPLSGFMNNREDGLTCWFNFVLANGVKSRQRFTIDPEYPEEDPVGPEY